MADEQEKQCVTLIIKDLNSENYGYNALDDLITLGATVKECHYEKYNKHFITVTLPDSFSLGEEKLNCGFRQYNFFDGNGNKRGAFLIKINDLRICNILLLTKYRILTKRFASSSSDFLFEKIYFGNDKEELFSSETIVLNRPDRSVLTVETELAEAKRKCEEQANLLYPDWRSPLAYWDDSLDLDSVQALARKKED